MKKYFITAAIFMTGCFCAWGYLAAQSDGEKATEQATPSAKSSLLEIKEPSREDFEHCAKRAVDFMASWSEDQAKTDIALYELFCSREMPPELMNISKYLTQIKAETAYGHPELIAKKSSGGNIIVLYYNYHSDKWLAFFRYDFARTLDKNGEPQQWRCAHFVYGDSPEKVFLPLP